MSQSPPQQSHSGILSLNYIKSQQLCFLTGEWKGQRLLPLWIKKSISLKFQLMGLKYFISDKNMMTLLACGPPGLHIHLNIVVMFLWDTNLWAKILRINFSESIAPVFTELGLNLSLYYSCFSEERTDILKRLIFKCNIGTMFLIMDRSCQELMISLPQEALKKTINLDRKVC